MRDGHLDGHPGLGEELLVERTGGAPVGKLDPLGVAAPRLSQHGVVANVDVHPQPVAWGMAKLPPVLVVLDLDETLIAGLPDALPGRRPDFWWAGRAVYVRPHAHQLLVERFERGLVAVWTASDPGYARPILERILRGPLDPFQFVLTREHCVPSDDPNTPRKPLDVLVERGADPARTVVVDNRPATFAGHEANSILVEDYDGAEVDDVLLRLLQRLRVLDEAPDVRSAT